MKPSTILEVKDISLEEWLSLMRNPPKGALFVTNMFPSDAHKTEWLRTAHARPESDVKLLLRKFLVCTGSNKIDELHAQFLVHKIRNNKGNALENLNEHDQRLVKFHLTNGDYPVWEGLGWILDLLPKYPRAALNVIDAFFDAYWAHLTDNYLNGLFDAQLIIRNRYIESTHTIDPATKVLMGLDWRELEWLCGALYKHMGFDVSVTTRGDDDGVDVFAKNPEEGKTDLVVLQVKKWREERPIGKSEVRELVGTMDLHRATKGVLVTTGRYESGATKKSHLDPRIELLDRAALLRLLNEYCGADWFIRVDQILRYAKDLNEKS